MITILPYFSESPCWHSTVRSSRARHGLRCCMILSSSTEERRRERERCGFPYLNPHHVQTSSAVSTAQSEAKQRRGKNNKLIQIRRKVTILSEQAGRPDGEEEEGHTWNVGRAAEITHSRAAGARSSAASDLRLRQDKQRREGAWGEAFILYFLHVTDPL